jgi:hypothetical protein
MFWGSTCMFAGTLPLITVAIVLTEDSVKKGSVKLELSNVAIVCSNLGDIRSQPRKEKKTITSENCDGYLNEIQERLDGNLFKAMLDSLLPGSVTM